MSTVQNSFYRRRDVQKHNIDSKTKWVTYKDGVYDITNFVKNHPGGVDNIMMAAGSDLTPFWSQPELRQHFGSPVALELLEEMRIGTLHPKDVIEPDFDAIFNNNAERHEVGDDRHIYKCIVIGAGVSGLQCAKELKDTHSIDSNDILILEAQDYVGGRVRQMGEFIRGVHIDVGAEFLHGSGDTPLMRLAKELNEPLRDLFIWAQGDGGPLSAPVDNGYGLYCLKDANGKPRLLRYDTNDEAFVAINKVLWGIGLLDKETFSDSDSLYDYLASQNLTKEQIEVARAGFANTLCTNIDELSMKRCVQWESAWHYDDGSGSGSGNGKENDEKEEEKEEMDMDHAFVNSYKCVIDHLSKDLAIRLSSPVTTISHRKSSEAPFSGLVGVTTKDGKTFYTESLVVSASPHVLKSGLVSFDPPLSPEINEAMQTVKMHNIVKVILKFSEPVWPAGLRGMVMADSSSTNNKDKWLLPEIWFRDVSKEAHPDEPAKAYAVGFTTSEYAAKLSSMPRGEVLEQCLTQLDTVFSLLETEHMYPTLNAIDESKDKALPLQKPSEAFVGGMFWDWNPEHHPYIGGGYCSPVAGKNAELADLLRLPYGTDSNIFFAGEATNMPGATADAALESGVRAANQVANFLSLVESTNPREEENKE